LFDNDVQLDGIPHVNNHASAIEISVNAGVDHHDDGNEPAKLLLPILRVCSAVIPDISGKLHPIELLNRSRTLNDGKLLHVTDEIVPARLLDARLREVTCPPAQVTPYQSHAVRGVASALKFQLVLVVHDVPTVPLCNVTNALHSLADISITLSHITLRSLVTTIVDVQLGTETSIFGGWLVVDAYDKVLFCVVVQYDTGDGIVAI